MENGRWKYHVVCLLAERGVVQRPMGSVTTPREKGVRRCLEVRYPSEAKLSGSQAKWKLGTEVCWCRWTMLVSLDHVGVFLVAVDHAGVDVLIVCEDGSVEVGEGAEVYVWKCVYEGVETLMVSKCESSGVKCFTLPHDFFTTSSHIFYSLEQLLRPSNNLVCPLAPIAQLQGGPSRGILDDDG